MNPEWQRCWSHIARPGFYFRVLEEGEVGAGDEIVKVAEDRYGLSVAAANRRCSIFPGLPNKNLNGLCVSRP